MQSNFKPSTDRPDSDGLA